MSEPQGGDPTRQDVPAASHPDDTPADDVVLTTDDDAQRDDSTVRPGNVPD